MIDFFNKNLSDLDPAVAGLIKYEAERQIRKLILIPSESQAPAAVREALGSVFQNIYAEGYPASGMEGITEKNILDYEHQLPHYFRYSDLRYYKGVEYVDILEALAKRRASEAFATENVTPTEIFANVQPLSGSPANSAVYSALVPPGSTVMGMDLLHGGHLTHGSPVNRSGKLHNIVSYGIDKKTEKLNYDRIEELAREHKPKMIIAGFTSYPWMPDWLRFRKIADSVGAYFLADISHIAGMVAAGVVPSPIGFADVISFTTHKTLYGPRGACILSTDRKIAKKIDMAVFPGEQGGPHVNAIAGMAVSFKLARTPGFIDLQKQVIKNAAYFASSLESQGLQVPHGGTDTHMLLVDCKSVRSDFGASPDGKKGTPLMGDIAARILDVAGIVLNRNTIPGDKSARSPSGIRLGTPWITQRGFKKPEIAKLAEIIARILKGSIPYSIKGRTSPIYRAKIDFDLLEEAKRDVIDLACTLDLDQEYCPSGYPHHYFMHKPIKDTGGKWDIIEIEGIQARGFCNVVMTNDVYILKKGETQPTWILEADGKLLCPGVLKRPGAETTRFQLLVKKSKEARAAHWFRALSDGYIDLDKEDIFIKTPGPVVVRRLSHKLAESWTEKPPSLEDFTAGTIGWSFKKPYWIGKQALKNEPGKLKKLPFFEWKEEEKKTAARTKLFDVHKASGGKLVQFAGWEMPVQYSSIKEEHKTVRTKAGLFDVSHMGLLEFSGDNVHLFLNVISTNDISLLKTGESQYSFLLNQSGHVLDDIYVYRLQKNRYWMVVNAVNTEKDMAWINAVLKSSVTIDLERPWTRALGTETVKVENISDKYDQLALQGPDSTNILLSMLNEHDPFEESISMMSRNEILPCTIMGYKIYLSRTGYTGEPTAYEIFTAASESAAFWKDVIAAGKSFGLQPIGLGARDSLRIEAGLPLYGHEFAGPENLNPADSGFGSYVKLYKPFFIGKTGYIKHLKERQSKLVRFRIDDKTQIPQQGDIVVSLKGRVIGAVTSCSIDSNNQLTGLAYLEKAHTKINDKLGIYLKRNKNWAGKTLNELRPGDKILIHLNITVIKRFLGKRE